MTKVNVLPNGRVVLPIDLRRQLGVEKGGQIVAEWDGEVVRLSTPDRSLDEAGALFRSLLTGDASVADEVIADRRAESAVESGEPNEGGAG